MRSYTVVCQWEGRDQYEMDADEIVVSADSPAQAIARARRQWRLSFGLDYPHLRLTDSFIITPEVVQQNSP